MASNNEQRTGSPYASASAQDAGAPRNELRAKLRRGEVTLGLWCAIPSSFLVELVSAMDFDWVCVDTQHGLVGYADMVSMLQAAFAHRMPALVRVAANRPELIMGALDAGAAGVVVPLVNSVEEAARAAEACRYPPLGNRSWGPARAALQRSSYTPEEVNDDDDLCSHDREPAGSGGGERDLGRPGGRRRLYRAVGPLVIDPRQDPRTRWVRGGHQGHRVGAERGRSATEWPRVSRVAGSRRSNGGSTRVSS